jgi:hypothetical protein
VENSTPGLSSFKPRPPGPGILYRLTVLPEIYSRVLAVLPFSDIFAVVFHKTDSECYAS